MSFNRSIFAQFGKEFADEVKKYDSHSEHRQVEKKTCNHKSVKVINDQLICSCGAGWSGPRIAELYEKLKGGQHAR